MKNKFAIAETNGGRIQNSIFEGTLKQCEKYLSQNPCLGYGTNNASIYPINEYLLKLEDAQNNEQNLTLRY